MYGSSRKRQQPHASNDRATSNLGREQRNPKRARAHGAAESSASESARAAANALVDAADAQAATAVKTLMADTDAKAQQVQDLASQLRREQEQSRKLRGAVQEQVDAREALAKRYQASAASAQASHTASLKAMTARQKDLHAQTTSAACAHVLEANQEARRQGARADKAERALMSQLPHFDGQGCARHCEPTTAPDKPLAWCVSGAVL